MNDRIKELELQALTTVLNGSDPDGDIDEIYIPTEFTRVFTNLIIDDVLTILADQKNYNRCTYTTFDLDKGLCVTSELTKKIKEQFGNKQ